MILALLLVVSLLSPLAVQQSEISSSNEQSSYTNKYSQEILKIVATERFFPMSNRFQHYKNGSLLIPEKLFISFGKGEGQNTFDIRANNMRCLKEFKLIESKYLSFQDQLSLNQLIHIEKKPDKVKIFNSSI